MLTLVAYFLGAVGVLVLAIYLYYKLWLTGNKGYWPSRNVVLFQITSVVSTWDQFTFKNPFHVLEQIQYQGLKKAGAKRYGGVMEFRKPTLVLLDLDLMKQVMVKDFDHFINRRTFDMEKSDPLFHKMLVSQSNQDWKDLRATMSPTFATGKIRRMFDIFRESSERLTAYLGPKTRVSSEIEMRDVFLRYGLDVIAGAAFGLDSQIYKPGDSEFSRMAKKFQNQFSGKNVFKLIIAMFFPSLFNKLGISLSDREATNFFAGVVTSTIKHRDETGEKRDDFLQLLLETRNIDPKAEDTTNAEQMETFEKDAQIQKASKIPLTPDLILSQSLLFFIAGFDTMETLLIFAVYELALNQDVQERLYQELHDAAERNDGKLTYDTIMQAEYLDKVISEVLRKYPPGIRTERKCVRDYKVPNSDLVIEKDTIVAIPIYGIHHDEDYYPDPEKFDPERFSAENKAARHPYSYMPFGHGPRNCIAMRFALAEGKSCISHLIKDFKLEPSSKTPIPLKFATTTGFKPQGDLYLSLTPRK